jgi:hypothetical protein
VAPTDDNHEDLETPLAGLELEVHNCWLVWRRIKGLWMKEPDNDDGPQ